MIQRLGQVTDDTDAKNPVPGASVYVYNIDGTDAALTSDGTTPLSQPLITDQFGNYSYYAITGYYREDTWFAGKLRFRDNNIALGSPGADLNLRSDLAASSDATKGAALLNYTSSLAYGAGTVGAKLKQVIHATDAPYSAVPDGSTDNYAAITAALATGKTVRLSKTSAGSQYNVSQEIALTGNMGLIIEDGVVLHSTSSSKGALALSGNKNYVAIHGEINAPLAPYTLRYFNLQYSQHLEIRTVGTCAAGGIGIWHDASSQTQNEGNNRWFIGDLQAGGMAYGGKLDSHASFTVEGEEWHLMVGFSATTTLWQVGTSGHDTMRENWFFLSLDAQGVTPLLIDSYCSSNYFYLANWQGLVSPPVAHVRFNSGTVANHLIAGPGVQGKLLLSDLGTNTYDIPGANGERIFGGLRTFLGKFGYGVGAGGSVTQITSKTTSVTLNRVAGQVITTADNIAAGASASFGLVNSFIGADDEVTLWIKAGAADPTAYKLTASGNGGGSRAIGVRNISSGGLAEALTIGFRVNGGSIS